jgi:hypothetical protein
LGKKGESLKLSFGSLLAFIPHRANQYARKPNYPIQYHYGLKCPDEQIVLNHYALAIHPEVSKY